MPEKEITLYRLLKSNRSLPDGCEHDECASIISRNSDVQFQPGLSNMEVDHEIHEGTNWDQDDDNYPGVVIDTWPSGELGRIMVSLRVRVSEATNKSDEGNFRVHEFYDPNESIEPTRRRRWWVATNTYVTKVRVEKVLI